MCPESAEHFLADILSRTRRAKYLVGDAKDHGVILVPHGIERPRIALEESFEDLPITAELDYLAVHAYRLRNDAVGAVMADCPAADHPLMEPSRSRFSAPRLEPVAIPVLQDHQT